MKKEKPIVINSGHCLFLDEIWQSKTYAGILVGKPDAQFIIDRNLALLPIKLPAGSSSVHLIRPKNLKELRRTSGSVTTSIKVLPPITCGAIILSPKPVRNKQADMSFLTILWYQDNWAYPICNEVLRQISQLNWTKLAQDAEF